MHFINIIISIYLLIVSICIGIGYGLALTTYDIAKREYNVSKEKKNRRQNTIRRNKKQPVRSMRSKKIKPVYNPARKPPDTYVQNSSTTI